MEGLNNLSKASQLLSGQDSNPGSWDFKVILFDITAPKLSFLCSMLGFKGLTGIQRVIPNSLLGCEYHVLEDRRGS